MSAQDQSNRRAVAAAPGFGAAFPVQEFHDDFWADCPKTLSGRCSVRFPMTSRPGDRRTSVGNVPTVQGWNVRRRSGSLCNWLSLRARNSRARGQDSGVRIQGSALLALERRSQAIWHPPGFCSDPQEALQCVGGHVFESRGDHQVRFNFHRNYSPAIGMD